VVRGSAWAPERRRYARAEPDQHGAQRVRARVCRSRCLDAIGNSRAGVTSRHGRGTSASVRSAAVCQQDISTALMLGLDRAVSSRCVQQIPPGADCSLLKGRRPVLPLGVTDARRDPSIAIDRRRADNFDFSTAERRPRETMVPLLHRHADGVREKTRTQAKGDQRRDVTRCTCRGWRAEVSGPTPGDHRQEAETMNATLCCGLAPKRPAGAGAKIRTQHAPATPSATAGASPFQLIPGILGNDGGDPGQAD